MLGVSSQTKGANSSRRCVMATLVAEEIKEAEAELKPEPG